MLVHLLLRSYYNKQWSEAQRMIADLSQLDVPPEDAKPEQVHIVVCSHHRLTVETKEGKLKQNK